MLSGRANRTGRWAARGAGAALLLAVIALSVNPCPANDLFWQLRMGQDIAATGHPPRFDTYSWTRSGASCVMHEWLTFALLWRAYAWGGGFTGVWLLQVALTAAIFGLLLAFLLRETDGSPLTAFLLAIAAAVASSSFFQPRPHLFTYLFLTLTAGVALRAHRQPKRWRLLWILPPLYILWANLHAGVLVGVAVLTLFAAGEAAEACLAARRSRLRQRAHLRNASRFLRIGLLCAVATLVNPYGWQLHHNLLATIGNKAAMDTVVEWASPNFHDFSGKIVEGLAAIVLCGLAFSRRRRRFAPILLTIVLAHVALGAFRNVPLFALVGLLMMARHIQSALGRLNPSANRTALFGSAPPIRIFALAACAMVLLFALSASRRLQKSPETGRNAFERVARAAIALDSFPERACRFLEAQRLTATCKLYNDYDIGGYLIWRLPNHPVFIDGRADLYFDRVLEDYLKVHKISYTWRDVLARYRPEVALLSAKSAQARLFLTAPEWKLVYADADALSDEKAGRALVFVRRLPQFAHLPERHLAPEQAAGRSPNAYRSTGTT